MKKLIILFLQLILCASITLAENDPIRIGMVYSLTGPASEWGATGRQAAEMAQQEINAAGGVNGQKLELLFEDSRTNSAGAVTAYQKLVKQDKVAAVMGDVWDFVTNPLVPLTQRDRTLLISPTVVTAAIETKSDYFYTLGGEISLYKPSVDKFFARNPQIKKVAIFCFDNPWGNAHANVWKEVLAERKIELVEERKSFDFDHDYRADVAAVVAKKPDAVMLQFHHERIVRRLHELGSHPTLFSTNDIEGVLKEGLLSKEDVEGAYLLDVDPGQEFKQKYTSAYGHAPMFEAQNHYFGVKALAQALSNSSKPVGEAIKEVRLAAPAGPIDFSKGFGANFAVASLKRIEDGKVVEVN